MTLFIQLFLAHIIGDFFLQWDAWVRNKEEKKAGSLYLYLHVCIHFLLIMLIVGSVNFWIPALVIALSHFFIDLTKLLLQRENTRRSWFFMDQAAHFIVLFIVWIFYNKITPQYDLFQHPRFLVLVTSILVLLYPSSYFIRAVISKWTPGITEEETEPASLQAAGRLIGFLERIIILLFILLGKWEGVGFLLAAKSIFRFGDLKDSKDRKLTEYVMIGTLFSFGIAMCIGVITKDLLNRLQ